MARRGGDRGPRRARPAGRPLVGLCALAMLLVTVASPLAAHKDHQKQQEAAAQIEGPAGAPAAPHGAHPAVPGHQIGASPAPEQRSPNTTAERLLDWLGRLHPIMVHFPIAFFPAALFTAIVGRRRPAFAAPVQFLVVAGGIFGPLAALLGWLDGGFDLAGDDWLLRFHRWLGSAIGLGALGLAVWAWRRPQSNRGAAMIAALSVITVAVVVQGWFGGALVHGVDHMNW